MDDWINNLWWCIHGLPSLVAQLVKNLPAMQRLGFDPWVEKIPWRRAWQPTPVLLPGKSHGQRSLEGCSPWGRWKSDTTEWLHFHFSLSCIGEGNGNPLQCFCLENPRDGGAWWSAVYGVAQSWTRLTWLCSSSSRLGERGDLIERLGLTYKHYYIQIYN